MYWVQRMEPIIRAETDEEIIVIFCNRCGMEGETVYAGTSTVMGIKQGEVSVYGLLGRCEKSLLVVDTDSPPLGKLVLRPGVEPNREPEVFPSDARESDAGGQAAGRSPIIEASVDEDDVQLS